MSITRYKAAYGEPTPDEKGKVVRYADHAAEMREAYKLIQGFSDSAQRFTFHVNNARLWLSAHDEYAPKEAAHE